MTGDQQFVLKSLTEAIQDGQVVIIGPIRQEVLSGIRDQSQFDKLKFALSAFNDEQLKTHHFEEAARLFNICRSRGMECGSTDILVCAVAAEKKWEILTYDQGLKRCTEFLRSEGLMQ